MRFFDKLAVAFLAATAVAGWETGQMPEKIRKELCAEQVLFCTNVCGGEGFTREAFCNVNTLGSKCTCSNGAEAAIRRYQWPAFQRVCEAQREECRQTCDHNNKIAASDRAFCFNSCDSRLSCNAENAPDLKVMVQKFDDPTTGSPKTSPALVVAIKPSDTAASAAVDHSSGNGSKDSKIKERKGGKDEGPKRRGGPLPTASSASSAAGVLSAMAIVAAAIGGGLI
ncbi:hypothetical protein IWW37_003521 [Coemansia sp. RSA 2050]|nr:hypothetical protein IWW37_003521 [Coemansia sp. RSA 2050]KAJ2732931.1 hypothetical protein IW152_003425 [Coemansia sp. BCRC 34962]